ncbi:hypothetical protein [Longimycelium tulufanense]|uniref:hypothetical protein n=1 Tax=Longimycelium tulufanense TaxID=907463 RepID=UPI0016660BDC|nr:hypothetical protein [Longimycelium tulufanense]
MSATPGSSQLAERLGIGWDACDPALGLTANEPTLKRIYTYYGEMLLRETEMEWARLSNLACKVVLAGLQDLRAVRKFLALGGTPESLAPRVDLSPDVLRSLAQIADAELRYFEAKLVSMAKDLFADLMWQHDAYANGGIEAMRRLNAAGEVPAGLLRVWADIASRAPELVELANERILHREQLMVLQPSYDEMLAQSPIPGGAPFAVVAGPTANITTFEARWRWITTDALPRFRYLLANDPATILGCHRAPGRRGCGGVPPHPVLL